MSKILHLSDEVTKVIDYHRALIGKKHPSLVNSKTKMASYTVVIKKALKKSGMWIDLE